MATYRTPDPELERWVDAIMTRIHKQLQRTLKAAGKGSLARVSRALRISRHTIGKWRQRKRLDLRMLLRILRCLGVGPGDFWRATCGPGDPLRDDLRKETAQDQVVQAALARLAGGELTPISEEGLSDLDRQRDDNPKVAVRRAKSALKTAVVRQIPRLLAIYGSAQHAAGRLDKAFEALRCAARLAEQQGDQDLFPDALKRLGLAHGDAGNQDLGLLYAREAAQEHRLQGNQIAEGRALIDQGARYWHLGQLRKANGALRLALRLLPEGEARNRYSALLWSARCTKRLGNLAEAMRFFACAEELAPAAGPDLAISLITIKAEISYATGDYESAERDYLKAVNRYRVVSPLDAAAASIELSRIQLRAGKPDAARETITRISGWIEKVSDKLRADALWELLRAIFAQAIDRHLIEHTPRDSGQLR